MVGQFQVIFIHMTETYPNIIVSWDIRKWQAINSKREAFEKTWGLKSKIRIHIMLEKLQYS